MRRTFIGLLMAATAVTPMSGALAQDAEEWRGGSRAERQESVPMQVAQRERGERRGGGERAAPQSRGEMRGEWQRQARQQQSQEAFQQRQAAQAQAQARIQAQAEAQAQAQAQAQRGGWDRQRQGRQQSQTDRNWEGDRNNPRHERARERYNQLERQHQAEQRGEVYHRQPHGRFDNRNQWQPQHRGDVRNQWQSQQHAQRRAQQRWDRSWHRDQRYNWQHNRHVNRHLYRMPSYHVPYRGHRYSRFSIGFVIGQPLFHQRYWISDPWRYRLPQPYPGYQWVRYYDDVLLIDSWTGEVVDVIYDFFW